MLSALLPEGHAAKCAKCGNQASVRVKYAKLNLCKDHFIEYVENRVYKSIKRYKMLEGTKRILVALSGGKDSLSLLYILSKLVSEVGLEEIYGFHLDLGIGNYSQLSRELVDKACRETGVDCIVISLEGVLGYTLPSLVKATRRPPCSLCGLIKRYFVNLVAVELGVDAVALGHHLDDILPFALKDFMVQDLQSLSKMVPVTPGVKGLVATRLKLLYEVYESDLHVYSRLRGIKFVEEQCPYKYADPFKEAIQRMLSELEERAPGFKLTFARNLAKAIPRCVGETANRVVPCTHCGMPSSTGMCSYCRLTLRVFGEPRGPYTRSKVREAVERYLHG